MAQNSERHKFWEQSLQVAKQDISELDRQIEDELSKVRDRLIELQKARQATLQIYDAACARLGLVNDLANDLAEAASSAPAVK